MVVHLGATMRTITTLERLTPRRAKAVGTVLAPRHSAPEARWPIPAEAATRTHLPTERWRGRPVESAAARLLCAHARYD